MSSEPLHQFALSNYSNVARICLCRNVHDFPINYLFFVSALFTPDRELQRDCDLSMHVFRAQREDFSGTIALFRIRVCLYHDY